MEIPAKDKMLLALLLAGLFSAAAAEKQTYIYKTAGDLKIEVDVYRPAGEGPFPAVLMLHGGALIMGNRNVDPKQAARYVAAGYVMASADYRLAPETKASGIFDDLRDVWRWLRTEKSLRIDPLRVAVAGGSAGGYLALVSGYLLEPRPQAIVSFFGFGDPTEEWESKPWPPYLRQPLIPEAVARKGVGSREITNGGGKGRAAFYLYCRQTGRWPQEVIGFDPENEPRIFDRYCPVRNVTRDYPPTLLWHGDRDIDVPYEQSVKMAAELKRRHVEHELVTVPGGGHGFPMTDEKYTTLFEFLNKNLK
jgi:acetyl esterase/lipase